MKLFDSRRIRQQLTTARTVGMITAQFVSREVGNSVRNVRAAVTKVAVKPQRNQSDSLPSSPHLNAEVGPDAKAIDMGSELAIANYPTLSALHIVAQLEFLSADELRSISVFEHSHRKRRTVMFKIDQLLKK